MKCKYFILTLLLIAVQINTCKTNREKRYLLFPPSTQYGLYATISIPLPGVPLTSVAWYFEANYYTVANASYFDPLLGDFTISRSREKRKIPNHKDDFTRHQFYIFIENFLESKGFPGRKCLLRAICENVNTHLLHNGLLGDLIHLILTPSLSEEEEDLDQIYYEAEYLGYLELCQVYKEDCPINPIDLFSSK